MIGDAVPVLVRVMPLATGVHVARYDLIALAFAAPGWNETFKDPDRPGVGSDTTGRIEGAPGWPTTNTGETADAALIPSAFEAATVQM